MCSYARCQGDVICIKTVENPQEELPTHDIELVVVVLPLKRWRHYLYGVHVDVFTDRKSIQYVFTQTELNLC